MSLPSLSFDPGFKTPRLVLLEVRDRLAPAAPIAHLLVERTVTQRLSTDGIVMEARIELDYQRLDPGFARGARAGAFVGGYSHYTGGQVSITSGSPASEGGVFLDLPGLQGQRIGTYLMNQVVLWVKRWPHAQLATVHLYASGAHHQDNRLRRNRLYEQFGVTFDYDDPQGQGSGGSRTMAAGDLTACDAWRHNITERPVLESLEGWLQEQTRARQELATRERAVKDLCAEINAAQARPMWWAVRELWRNARMRLR